MIQTLLGDRRFVEVHALHQFDLGDIAGSVLESINGLRSSTFIPHLRISRGLMLDPHSCLKHARSRCNVHVATATHSTPSLLAAWHKTSELPRRRQSWYVGRQRALQTPDSKGPASIRSCVSQGTKQDLRKRPIAFWRGSHQTSVQLPGLVETMANRKKMKIENLHRSILFRLFHFHDCCSDGSDTLSNTLFKSL